MIKLKLELWINVFIQKHLYKMVNLVKNACGRRFLNFLPIGHCSYFLSVDFSYMYGIFLLRKIPLVQKNPTKFHAIQEYVIKFLRLRTFCYQLVESFLC